MTICMNSIHRFKAEENMLREKQTVIKSALWSEAHASAKYKLVQKQYAILSDTLSDLSGASKYFQMLPDPPEAKQSALRLCMSILRMLRDLTYTRLKFWSSWDLCADLRETSRPAETTAQHCGRLGAILSHQLVLHRHKAFRWIIFVFVTGPRFATS